MKSAKLKNKKTLTWKEELVKVKEGLSKLAADFTAQNERNFKYFASKKELREVKENMMTKEDGKAMENRIMTLLDVINYNILNIVAEQTANIGAHERFDKRLNSHEYRMKCLESHFRLRPESTI